MSVTFKSPPPRVFTGVTVFSSAFIPLTYLCTKSQSRGLIVILDTTGLWPRTSPAGCTITV